MQLRLYFLDLVNHENAASEHIVWQSCPSYGRWYHLVLKMVVEVSELTIKQALCTSARSSLSDQSSICKFSDDGQ
eukprot:3445508-Amphidinium_carterae.2